MTDGEKIQQLRVANKMTQAQLSEKMGVHTATVAAWECGRNAVRPERLSVLGSILNHDFESIAGDISESFGSSIRALRVQRGLSQAQFAKLIGVSNVTVSRWEKGAIPNRRIVLQQLEAHGVPLPVEYKERRQSTTLGTNLTRLRLKAELSQKALGQAIGVDDTSISAWETGRYVPSEDNLDRLCKYFGITPAEIMRRGK